MPTPAPSAKTPPPPPPENGPLAGLLSYLVPGLGQIYQGRVAKGVLFFVCIYALFFYGMYLGSWRNVYLPDTADTSNPWNLWRPVANLYNRPHFVGQFWVGAAAWPAIWQYYTYDPAQNDHPPLRGFMRQPPESELQQLQRDGDKTWDLAWVYTVIAGVLNVMVIYDAFAGPAFVPRPAEDRKDPRGSHANTPVAAGR
jgi:hypothetical protein